MSLQDIFSLSQFNTECLQIAQTMFIQGLQFGLHGTKGCQQFWLQAQAPEMHDITLKSKGLKYDKETKLKVHF